MGCPKRNKKFPSRFTCGSICNWYTYRKVFLLKFLMHLYKSSCIYRGYLKIFILSSVNTNKSTETTKKIHRKLLVYAKTRICGENCFRNVHIIYILNKIIVKQTVAFNNWLLFYSIEKVSSNFWKAINRDKNNYID